MLHDSLGFALDDDRLEFVLLSANSRKLTSINVVLINNFVCFVCRIRFADNAGAKNTPLDWALGAFILNNAKARYDYSGKSRNILGFKKKKVKAM